jgi:hypothetical protein
MLDSLSVSSNRIAALILLGSILLSSTSVLAFETDQYDLPPAPLADIGDEVSEHVERQLHKAVDKINAELSTRQRCVNGYADGGPDRGCDSLKSEQSRLAYLRTEDAMVRGAFDQLGAGVPPFTSMGTWMDWHHFHGQPARYRTSYLESIFILLPPIALTISPTVNMYGSEVGTDKIAHLFQQGYSYYKIYRRALAERATPEAATAKAVRWGQKTERTYFGTLVAGVYSNGDLAANYVGLKFYEGLTQSITIGNSVHPAVLVLKDGLWTFSDSGNVREQLLKPFISDHLNEALNPSIFTKNFGLRWYIRRAVRKRSCAQWFERYPDLSKSGLEGQSRALTLWQSEDYGFTDSEHFVTIANTCFENEPRAGKDHSLLSLLINRRAR